MDKLNLMDESIKRLKDYNCKVLYIQPQHIVFCEYDIFYKCRMIDVFNSRTLKSIINKSTKPETIGDIKR